ncbi:hypothetical protein BOO69_18230 [Sulfitobacter alexandrii]|uniref:Uncharacterized protein n=1 Tax=Sulfitobacter alexandrii TaxID=1917485 RepID=A0A1J0WL91_9RHOB|nr:hypothetical protein BOO69_18230 [Sulfitobacter alexandrii]
MITAQDTFQHFGTAGAARGAGFAPLAQGRQRREAQIKRAPLEGMQILLDCLTATRLAEPDNQCLDLFDEEGDDLDEIVLSDLVPQASYLLPIDHAGSPSRFMIAGKV